MKKNRNFFLTEPVNNVYWTIDVLLLNFTLVLDICLTTITNKISETNV